MNKILNNKINSDLKRIIGTYLLPINSNIKDLLDNLIYKTRYIKYNLHTNTCVDELFYYYNDLDHTKIRHIDIYSNNDSWTIRKC